MQASLMYHWNWPFRTKRLQLSNLDQIWLESIRWTFLNVTYSMYLVADVIFIYLTMVSTATSRFEKASSELHGCSRLLGNERGGNASKSRIFTNLYGVEPPLLLNFNFGDTLNKFHLQTLVSLDQKKIERRKTAGHFVKLPDILVLNYAKTEFFKFHVTHLNDLFCN